MTNNRTPHIFTALDLELNQPSNKIIQIGAVVGNILTGEVIDKFNIIVNPHEQLGYCNDITKSITDLTGITQEQVDAGVELEEAYLQLKAFHEKHKAFINPVTWGGGDSNEIREQLQSNLVLSEGQQMPSWCFGRRWIDAKTLYIGLRLSNQKPPTGGLARALINMGLKFEGRQHDALDDAYNTFRIFYALLNKFQKDVQDGNKTI